MLKHSTSVLLTLLCILAAHVQAEITLTGETNAPETSMFAQGAKVKLFYHVSGLQPNQGNLTLELNVVDEKEKSLKKFSLPVKADSEGRWSATVAPPCERLGFYRVYSKLSNGILLSKLASRKAGFLTYAVVFGEDRYKEYPMEETFFGNHGPSFGFHRMIGLRWGYKGKNWSVLEPKKPGEYARNPKADQIDLLGELPKWKEYYQTNQNPIPKWMEDPRYRITKNGKWVRFTPEGEKYYAEYLKTFAANYAKQIKQNQVRALIQITWEPHFPWNFSGTAEDLVQIHKNAYQAIHAGTKDAWVIGPTAAGLDTLDWHRELFEAGLLKYVDAISIHPYFAFPPEQNGMVEKVRAFKALIRKYAGRDLDIHGNEAGFPTHELPEREILQMHGIVRSNLILLGEGFKSNMVFYSHDYWGEPGYGYTYNLNPKREFGTDKIAPKPLVPAIGAAAYFLNGHTSAGAIESLGDTAWGYAYQRKDGFTTLALWDYSGNPREVEIPVGRAEIELGDMMGNTRKVKTDDGTLKLTLTEDPVYVIDVDLDLWGRGAVRPIAPDQSKISAISGGTVTISGTLHAKKVPMNGTLLLSGDPKWKLPQMKQEFQVKAGKAAAYSFRLVLPKNLPEGNLPLMLKFVSGGKSIAATPLLLQIKPPVAIDEVLPDFRNGKKCLKIKMRELSGNDIEGNLETRIVGNPDGRKRMRFRIKGGGSAEILCVYDDLDVNPLKNDDLELTVATDSGFRFKRKEKMNFLSAVYRPGIRIDGNLADWKGVPVWPFEPDMIRDEAKIYQGRKDLDASISFAWNESGLLFLVDVRDNVYCQPHTGWQTWDGDSLQMGFTRRVRYKETANMLQDKMNVAYSEIDFALTKNGPEVYRTVTFDNTRFPIAQISLKDAPLKVVKTLQPDGSTRLQYEISVPWKFLNMPSAPGAGSCIGWSMSVNDRDQQKGPRAWLEAFRLKKPEDFGILVLTK